MAELMQPNIVGNFLNAYQSGLERQEAQKEAERQRMRQDRSDQMSEQRFQFDMDAGQLDMALRRGAAMNEILAGVDERNPQTLEIAKQRYLTTFGGKPEDVAQITMADIPRIKLQTGQTLKELDLRLKQAQIGTEQEQGRAARALASQRYAAASGGGSIGGQIGAVPSQVPESVTVGGDSTVLAPMPYDNFSDPKARDRDYLQEKAQANKIKTAARSQADKSAATKAAAQAFVKLNDRTDTGGMYATPIIGGMARSLGSTFDTDVQQMEAITARIVPGQREPGSGAASDLDARMFERATVGVDKGKTANKAIANAISAQADRDSEYLNFVDWYFQRHRTTQGMDQAWQEFVNANPIFDPQKQEAFSLNQQKKSWRQFFGVGQPNAARGTAQQSGLQEGQRSRSKSGKPIIVRNGKWVFE
jgi:hypothetical protein